MKILITGMNGTVAPAVAKYAREKGHDVVVWDRTRVPIDDVTIMSEVILGEKPDWFFHIATGAPEWAQSVAKICFDNNIGFLFTSTVSVFSENSTGPYFIDSIPNAEDDYGKYKRDCERRINSVNSKAYIVRLGWQIGSSPSTNNMFAYLERTMKENEVIQASTLWYPSCSFLEDTAEALVKIIIDYSPGLYLANGNKKSTFFEIVNGLNKMHGKNWNVTEGQNPARDDRMFDDRVVIKSIEERLGL